LNVENVIIQSVNQQESHFIQLRFGGAT